MVSFPFIMCFHVYFSGILGEIAIDDWGDAILNWNDVESFYSLVLQITPVLPWFT